MRLWTPAEVALLGTATDAAVGRKIKRSAHAVLTKRRELGIAALRSHARTWSKRELNLLGTMPDTHLAAQLGCTRKHVYEMRQRLGIAHVRR